MWAADFGWDLPPGVTQRMIDEHFEPDEPEPEYTGPDTIEERTYDR